MAGISRAMAARTYTLLVVMSTIIAATLAFPDGAPEKSCFDMMPGTQVGVAGEEGHTAVSQNDVPTYGNSKTPPYYMLIHKSDPPTYSPGESITVSIVANQTTGMVMFKGILLQMRRVMCASDVGLQNQTVRVYDETVGTFAVASTGSETLLKTLACDQKEDSAVTHKSPQFKINETVIWTAPSGNAGSLMLRATLVQEPYIYWTEVYSKVIQEADGGPPAECDACNIRGHVILIFSLLIGWLLLLEQ